MTNEDKQIAFAQDSEKHIRNGVNAVCDAVGVTMGSDGKYVMIQKKGSKTLPSITKDGVTVAKEIQLEHPIEDCSAKLVIDGCMRTLAKLGDGTTSTAVQIKSLVNSIFDARSEKLNMRKFLLHLNEIKAVAIESMKDDVIKDVTLKHLIDVATVSANNDSEIGTVIGTMYHKIGGTGSISIYHKDIDKIDVKYAEGYTFDSGLMRKEFINSGADSVMKDPLVLVTNRVISKLSEIMRFMDYCYKNNRSLLIIAGGYSEEVMSTILKNVGKFNVCPVLAPSLSDMRNSYLEDICSITGSYFINGEEDIFFEDVITKYDMIMDSDSKHAYMMSVLGTVEMSTVSKDEVVLTHNRSVYDQTKMLQEIIDGSDDELVIEFTNKRISTLKAQAVEIYFPILTATENSFNHDRYDDSFKATLSALKNGVSVGGGKSYVNAYNKIDGISKQDSNESSTEYSRAISVIKECMLSVIMTSLVNGDYSDEEIKTIVENISGSENPNYGYNTVTKSFEDLVESGVVESGISAQTCFSTAFSIASTLTNVSCSITYAPSLF